MSDLPCRRVSGSASRQRMQITAVRCTADERVRIAAAAERAGLPVGAFMRQQALGTAGPRAAKRPPRVDQVALAQTLGLLGRVGGNVNQLAKAFNTDTTTPAALELAAIRTDILAMRDALMQALGQTP